MDQRIITQSQLHAFGQYLIREEKSTATVEKYLRDSRAFVIYLAGRPVTKEEVLAYKQQLLARNYALRSINSMLASLNSLFSFLGWADCHVRALKQQKQVYCAPEKELTRGEYLKLLEAAGACEQLHLVMQTICSTGIRVSELAAFTVEGVRQGETVVRCKGKSRTILIPGKLRKLLLAYARKKKIRSGAIFLARNGKPLDRRWIWARMKSLCRKAGIDPRKVFPPQSAQAFCTELLCTGKGHCQAGGCSGPQQYRYHPNLYHDQRHRAPQKDRASGACSIEKRKPDIIHIMSGKYGHLGYNGPIFEHCKYSIHSIKNQDKKFKK